MSYDEIGPYDEASDEHPEFRLIEAVETHDGETLHIIQYLSGPWAGIFEVRDQAGLSLSTGITAQIAAVAACDELYNMAESVEDAICDILHGGSDW